MSINIIYILQGFYRDHFPPFSGTRLNAIREACRLSPDERNEDASIDFQGAVGGSGGLSKLDHNGHDQSY